MLADGPPFPSHTMPLSPPGQSLASVFPTGEESCSRPGGQPVEGWNPAGFSALGTYLGGSFYCLVWLFKGLLGAPVQPDTHSGVRAMEVEAPLGQTSQEASLLTVALALELVFPDGSPGAGRGEKRRRASSPRTSSPSS